VKLSRRHWPLAAFAGLVAVLGAGLGQRPRELPSALVGRAAPPFRLPRLGSALPPLDSAELRGRAWVLNVWASWCAPCREEHPLLVQVAREGGVHLVGLNYKDDPRAAAEWLLRLGNPYAASVLDQDGRVGIDYGVYGVPETFVVDRFGVVRLRHAGPLTAAAWQGQVQPLLRQLEG
jgi:cytochrome c biogenesis protein CcmG/thiol:disulfide interchange protein DsbE